MPDKLLRGIAAQEQINILSSSPLSGGDINLAFKLQTDRGDFFLKANKHKDGFHMLGSEAQSLSQLNDIAEVNVPKVFGYGQHEEYAFLRLSYVPSEATHNVFWENLAAGLYQVHQQSASKSGWPSDNFIGLLPQINRSNSSWPEFYAEQRLQVQIELAKSKGLIDKEGIKQFDRLRLRLADLLPEKATQMLHGDLWSGNYLCGPQQQAFLIDPACYYGHYEVDLAMSRLFGGLDSHFYHRYWSYQKMDPGYPERIAIYQLYYLLAHLNMFGRSYWGSIAAILAKFVD